MNFITIDTEKCNKDYICVNQCPSGIFRTKEEGAVPVITKVAKKLCIQCGHCVSICPHGAIEHETVPLSDCVKIEKELNINQRQAFQYLRSRRSARRFKDKPVDKELLNQVILMARYAPSAGNGQPVNWTVFSEPSVIQRIASMCADWMKYKVENEPRSSLPAYYPAVVKKWEMGSDDIARNAPALIVASAKDTARWGTVDISIALSYLELAATPLGLMTCWAGFIKGALDEWQPLKEFVGLPDSHVFQIPIMIGYGKYKFQRLPERKLPNIDWK